MHHLLIIWIFLRAEICDRHHSMHGRNATATGVVFAHSTDDGSTLDFSNKNFVEVTVAGAEELVELGKGDSLLDECRILRFVGMFLLCFCSIHSPYFMQDRARRQPSLFTPYNVLSPLAPSLPNSSFKLVYGSRSGKSLCLSTIFATQWLNAIILALNTFKWISLSRLLCRPSAV